MSWVTKKYQGIVDRAATGRSPKSAIHASCLRCMSCSTKEIRDCTDEECPLRPYRPYQKIPWKSHRGKPQQILDRAHKGKIARKSISKPLSVSKDIIIPEGHTERLRVRIVVEAENDE